LLEDEARYDPVLVMVRGERAGSDQAVQAIQGKQMIGIYDGAPDGGQPSVGDRVGAVLPGAMKRQRAAMLRYMDQVCEAAKLPPPQRAARFAELEVAVKAEPVMVRLLSPAVAKMAQAGQRSLATVRCALVAAAAERFRLANGRWPKSAQDLVAAGL